MSEKDALDKLIIDEEENPNVELLAELVLKYLKFSKKTGEIIFNEEFYNLMELQKILVYLLGRKVITIKKIKGDFDEKITQKEIENTLGIKGSSVRKYVSVDFKNIVKSENKKYFIPNYNLYKCKEKLKENGRANSKKKN